MGDTLPADQKSGPVSVAKTLDFLNHGDLRENGTMVDADVLSKGHPGLNSISSGAAHAFAPNESDKSRGREPHNVFDIKEVDSQTMHVSISAETDVRSLVVGSKKNGFQELLQLAQEFESEESAKRAIIDETAKSFEELPKENGIVNLEEQHKLAAKENCLGLEKAGVKPHKNDVGESSNCGFLTPQLSKTRRSSSSSLSSKSTSKIAGKSDKDGTPKRKMTTGEVGCVEGAENTICSQGTNFQRAISIGHSRSNFTVPQPFSLATDKRASFGGRPLNGVTVGQALQFNRLSGSFGNSNSKSLLVSNKMGPKSVVVKSLLSESTKHRVESFVELSKQLEPKIDEDEIQSVSSVQSGSKASIAKASHSMSAAGFQSKCEERAEKRREFYTKLEEKLNAKEVERNKLQAKTKEQLEAEIRQLRKSLTFKATPMPRFYQEGAPAKAELKKIPPTRAKSPKLGRKSSSVCLDSEGGSHRSCREASCEQEHSSSDSQPKSADSETGDRVSMKSNSGNINKTVRRSLSRLSTEKLSKCKLSGNLEIPKHELSSPEVDTSSLNESSDSSKVRVALTPDSFSACASDDDKNLHDFQEFTNKQDNEHGAKGSVVREDGNPGHIARSVDFQFEPVSESLDCDGDAEKNILFDIAPREFSSKDVSSFDTDNGNKVKSGKMLQQAVNGDSQDVNVKTVRHAKRERLKASAPSFRNLKRESVGSVKGSVKSSNSITLAVADVVVQS